MVGQRSRYAVALVIVLVLFPLAGCYLASGERMIPETLSPDGIGQTSAQFVNADGTTEREILVGQPAILVELDVAASAEWGELILEFLAPDGSTMLTVESRYGRAGRGSAIVVSDEAGQVRYRVTSREARNGSYTIRYRTQAVPTPTPAATP
jgi:hypothetical protein